MMMTVMMTMMNTMIRMMGICLLHLHSLLRWTQEPILIFPQPEAESKPQRHAVVTCEIKLFQNYFRGLLQLINIFQHVQCRLNNFEIISAAEITLFQFHTWLHVK